MKNKHLGTKAKPRAPKSETLFFMIYNVMQARPFCGCSQKNKEIYEAYCLRVAETVTDKFWDKIDKCLKTL